MSAMFLRHEGFLGAVGAFLKVHPLSPAALQNHTSKEPRKVQNSKHLCCSPACHGVPADLLRDLACVQFFCIRLPPGCCSPACRQVPADFFRDLACAHVSCIRLHTAGALLCLGLLALQYRLCRSEGCWGSCKTRAGTCAGCPARHALPKNRSPRGKGRAGHGAA